MSRNIDSVKSIRTHHRRAWLAPRVLWRIHPTSRPSRTLWPGPGARAAGSRLKRSPPCTSIHTVRSTPDDEQQSTDSRLRFRWRLRARAVRGLRTLFCARSILGYDDRLYCRRLGARIVVRTLILEYRRSRIASSLIILLLERIARKFEFALDKCRRHDVHSSETPARWY